MLTNIGDRFGRWEVIDVASPLNSRGSKRWLCQCTCGTIRVVDQHSLRQGTSRSCGCLRDEGASRRTKLRNYKHGHTPRDRAISSEYNTWKNMKKRCYVESTDQYSYYGGRGIYVYGPWISSFEEFYNYVGPKPSPQHSLDRINNDGNYEPGNVRWATKKQQVANRRKTAKP